MKTIPAFYFEREKLNPKVDLLHQKFKSAKPFEHVVIDGFLPKPILKLLIDEFPTPGKKSWKLWGPGRSFATSAKKTEKSGISDETCFGPFTRHFMSQWNSQVFLEFLEGVSGQTGLITDPSYNGCGLHSTGRGGRLMIHTDVNRHPFSGQRLHQILNGILYLNEDWKDEYGGHLEFWDSNRQCKKSILPKANRFVLFQTGTKSFHGHPKPLSCPETRHRNSIAVYYYMLDRGADLAYEGMQTGVNWIPSESTDFEFINATMFKFEKWLLKVKNKTLHAPKHILPDPILLLDWKESSRSKKFPEGLRPFAVTGTKKESTLLLDNEGRVYIAQDSSSIRWLTFIEPLMEASVVP